MIDLNRMNQPVDELKAEEAAGKFGRCSCPTSLQWFRSMELATLLNDRRHQSLYVLTVSGLLGFGIGIFRFPTWQVAVEAAQVVAGIVHYPPDTPFYIYQMKLWTVLHQVCAVLLRAGLSEITVSRLLSGLLGMVSFQALSMLTWAISRDGVLAIGAPALILYSRAAEHGAVYPISLMGTDHTYGVIGLSTAALVVALLGAGCVRLGGFLLGVAPAIHAALGAWLGVIVAICALWDYKRLRADWRPALPYFAAGAAVTAVSLLVHFAMSHDVGRVDAAVSSRYLTAFVNAWDDHRRPAALVSVGTILNVDALLIALLWLYPFAGDVPRPARFVLRAVAVSAVLSLAAMFVSWLPPSTVPPALLTVMPSRFLNFNVLVFVPLVLGLLGIYRRSFWSQLVTVALLCGLFASYRSMVWDAGPAPGWLARRIQINPWHVFVAASVALVAVRATPAWQQSRALVARTGARPLSLALLAVSVLLIWQLPQPYPMLDRTNDPFFSAVADRRTGMLLTGGSFHLVQLYTRRPVLLDGGALDTLTYAPAAGPAMERILREVYELDFFNPPAEARRTAAIPHRVNKPVWERRSRRQWEEIGRTFNVSQVLTRADWSLDLPILVENRYFKLYGISD
jgi:hypothetical protein